MKRSGKLLIVGGSGFVGSAVARAWRLRPSITTYCNRPLAGAERFDIARERLADRFLQPGHGFSHAILAHGATTLERCALMPEARAINVRGTLQAIDDLVEAGVHPVFLSSDGVFDGTRGRRTEQDAPNPILAYGRQKLAVEAHLQAMTTPWTILRLTRVISGADHPRNLLSQWVGMIEKGTLIRCARDQILAPVDLAYVLQAVAFVVDEGVTGLVHLSGPELVTRADLFQRLVRHLPAAMRRRVRSETCRLDEVASRERLPRDCSLAGDRFAAMSSLRGRPIDVICGALCASLFASGGDAGRLAAGGA